jgi:hypothetical protein
VPKTYATWADVVGIAVGSVKRPGIGRAGLGSAGGGMIFGSPSTIDAACPRSTPPSDPRDPASSSVIS